MSEDRQSAKRGVILAGATEVFREEGFANASMDRIAEVAGVSKRTIYNHFGSKDALFETVVEMLISAVIASKQIAWNPELTMESQLRAFAKVKTSIVDDSKWLSLVKVVMGIAIQQPERAEETMKKSREGEAALERWLIDAERAGKLRVADPKIACQLFWGMVAGTLFWPPIFEAPQPAETRERLLDELIATFLDRYRVDGACGAGGAQTP